MQSKNSDLRDLIFRKSTVDKNDLLQHFSQMEKSFLNRIESSVPVDVYAEKLSTLSSSYEYWSNFGIVAVLNYYVDSPRQMLFISNLSILQNYRHKGLGSELMRKLIKDNPKFSIELEVGDRNFQALRFYASLNFKLIGFGAKSGILKMRYECE